MSRANQNPSPAPPASIGSNDDFELPVCGDAEHAAECDRVFGSIWSDVVRQLTAAQRV